MQSVRCLPRRSSIYPSLLRRDKELRPFHSPFGPLPFKHVPKEELHDAVRRRLRVVDVTAEHWLHSIRLRTFGGLFLFVSAFRQFLRHAPFRQYHLHLAHDEETRAVLPVTLAQQLVVIGEGVPDISGQ